MSHALSEVSADAVLGGRLQLIQPRRGHRVGHDAILLAAATAARDGEHIVELGAGVGAAGLAVAQRLDAVRVTLVERDPALAELAAENARRNGLAARVNVWTLDVRAALPDFAAAGLPPQSAQRVLMNPPFLDPSRHNLSPDPSRRSAHAAPSAELRDWVKAASRVLVAGGTLTLIWRADGLALVLGVLAGDFGGVAILPVHPRGDMPAIRILVRAVKGSRAPLALYPGLALKEANGEPTSAAEAVLRHAGLLPLAAE
jgi:tRNA1(Val) A37 N6-methylase TrmN6